MADESSALLSDEPTIELIARAQTGDAVAAEALLQRCLPPLKRWAHGRLPSAARGSLDTDDIVQSAALHLLKRLDRFEPQHVGAMQAYLRQSVINRIRDEMRRIGRQPPPIELPEELPSDKSSPLESAIQTEAYERYLKALGKLRPRDRELVVGRIEMQWTFPEIHHRFEFSTIDAARVAVGRAIRRLATSLSESR